MTFAARANGGRSIVEFVFSANTADAAINIATATAQSAQSRTGSYSAGNTDVVITVNPSVYVYSTNTSNAGLTLSGGSIGDTLTVVNNGYVMGMGGAGGNGNPNTVPGVGGTAVSLGFTALVNNTAGYIGGGGGGGGAGANTANAQGGGGGAGGGIGGHQTTTGGGAGGLPGNAGANGTLSGGGGGGGRWPIDTVTTTAGPSPSGSRAPGFGGKGGGSGSAASLGFGVISSAGGGGGGWGSAGGAGKVSNGTITNPATTGGTGGATSAGGDGTTSPNTTTNAGSLGGKAVALNGNSITWVGAGASRAYGAVS